MALTFLALEVRIGFVFPHLFLDSLVSECQESIKSHTGI